MIVTLTLATLQNFVHKMSLLLTGFDGVVSFLDQFFHGCVHLLASEVVNGQTLHYAVGAVGLDLDGEAVDQTRLDAV